MSSLGGLRFEKVRQKKVDSAKKPVYVLSCGAGVNTVALLVLIVQRKLVCDEVVFADTGHELPETYRYIEDVIRPLCRSVGLCFTVVAAPVSLYDYYFVRGVIPTRKHRDCTDKFKIQPIRRYLSYKYPKQKFQVYTYMGIAADELRRVNKKTLDVTLYPLVDGGVTREGCVRLIEAYGLSVPVKSGCYFCPFQSEQAWFSLWLHHHDLFLRSEALEFNCGRYPELFLAFPHIGPLMDLAVRFEKGYRPAVPLVDDGQVTLEQSCEWCEVDGSCFSRKEALLNVSW